MGYSLMLMGTRNASGPVSAEHFARIWRDPDLLPELNELGFERPEQLGALFIGGAEYLEHISADAPPLVDDRPTRLLQSVLRMHRGFHRWPSGGLKLATRVPITGLASLP